MPDYQLTPAQADDQAEANEMIQRRAMLKRLLRGRWHWAILLAILLGTAGGYLGYNSQTDEFSASSYIDVEPNYVKWSVRIQDPTVYEEYHKFVNDEVRRLRSKEAIESAMSQPAWQEAVGNRPEDLPKITVDSFVDSLKISAPENDEISIRVGFVSEDPATTSAAVNALFEAYRLMQKQAQGDQIDENIGLLQDHLEKRQRDLIAVQDEIDLVIPKDERTMIQSRLNGKLGELAGMEYRLSEIDLVVGPFLENANSDDPVTVRELMLLDPQMQELLGSKELLEDEYDYLTKEQGYGESMPAVVQVRRRISMTDRKIATLEAEWSTRDPSDVQASMPKAIEDMMGQRKAIQQRIDELQAQAGDMALRLSSVEEFEIEEQNVRDSIRVAKEQISSLKRTRETLVQNENISRIVMGPAAVTPTIPYNAGKRRQLAGVFAIGGMFTGFGMVILVGLLDSRFRHASDTALDMPDANVLGILPTLPADLTDPEDAETAAHCVHHIRTLLQIGGSNRVFSITSPTAGSGKSSLTTALGMSFSTSGSRTLVIDADLVGAGLSRRMGAVIHEPLDAVIRRHQMLDEATLARALTGATAKGVALEQIIADEHLLAQDQIEAAIRLQRDTSLGLLEACTPGRLRSCVASTEIQNLFILPVGKARPADASRLSPAAMREMIRQAREAYDIVLIDTGPVLGSLEASIAAAESDATVLIVSRGDHKSLATRSLDQLRSVRATIAGLVFNHALDRDVAHTSYASLVSQERRPARSVRKKALDKTRAARLGPLGSAVASTCEEQSPDEQQADYAYTNGQHNGND